jgi:TonB-dependent starch-binding outer membrane protein SusC
MRKKIKALQLLLALLLPGWLIAQTTVSGRVIESATSKPLVGATISVRGTQNFTQTDADGKFSISVPNVDARLVVTYVGYLSQTIEVKNSSQISLAVDNTNLSEVVVTGLVTSIKRSNSANSVATISAKQLTSRRWFLC